MGERGVAVVIEDDEGIRTSLTGLLQQSGFAVHSRSSGSEGVEAVREHTPDVVTVDLGLPDFDGIEASRRIRTFSDAYLIIFTARVDEADALMGFTAGADDYLAKPFRPRELRARIAAMLRRPRTMQPTAVRVLSAAPVQSTYPAGSAGAAEAVPDHDLVHKGLTLHQGLRRVAVDGVSVDLTRTQFELLLCLMQNSQMVQTKADLVRWLRNEPYSTGSFVGAHEARAVEVHLSNLRKRLGDNTRKPRWIETVRGLGYRMTP